MPKYKEYFKKMLKDNKDLFDNFQRLHDKYSLNPEAFQLKFNQEGEKVQEVIREYENRLCANTERGIYNKFSTNLAEKYQNEVRRHFPMIDHIGLEVEGANSQTSSTDRNPSTNNKGVENPYEAPADSWFDHTHRLFEPEPQSRRPEPVEKRPGYLLPALRREQNPSEAEIASHSSLNSRSEFSAKGDKSRVDVSSQKFTIKKINLSSN